MFLYDVDDTTQVNLENIDAVKLIKADGQMSLAVVINGVAYFVERSRHKDLITKLDLIQQSSGLTKQYYAA